MVNKPKESDWKHFKRVREAALQRLCQQALDAVVSLANEDSLSAHDRYQKVFRAIQEFDDHITTGFDNSSRSQMLLQLVVLHGMKLISNEELQGFSAELQRHLATRQGNA